jgi:hypothetical protein
VTPSQCGQAALRHLERDGHRVVSLGAGQVADGAVTEVMSGAVPVDYCPQRD